MQPASVPSLPFPWVLRARLREPRQQVSPSPPRGTARTPSHTPGRLRPPRALPVSPFSLAHRAPLLWPAALKWCLPALPDRGPAAGGHLPRPPPTGFLLGIGQHVGDEHGSDEPVCDTDLGDVLLCGAVNPCACLAWRAHVLNSCFCQDLCVLLCWGPFSLFPSLSSFSTKKTKN